MEHVKSEVVMGDIHYKDLVVNTEVCSWLSWRDIFNSEFEKQLGFPCVMTSFGENVPILVRYFKRLCFRTQVVIEGDSFSFTKLSPRVSVNFLNVLFIAFVTYERFDLYSNLKRDYELGILEDCRGCSNFENFTHKKLYEIAIERACQKFDACFGGY
jgi:hypothetical protein